MGKPKIRFKGYEDDWEQRKLGDCVEIISGEAPAKFQKGNINYVKVDDLNYAYKIVINTQNKVLKNSSAKMVQAGSVIFPKRGAAILTNKVRVLGVDSYMDTNMMALSSEKIDVDFLYIMLQKEGLYKIADTSTIPQINNKHIEPYKIYLPKMEEQHKIGTYFSNLDHLITLHQRKCEETKSLKKYMLQKMFPENGKCVPEIRFSGFSDDWEQRKFSEFVKNVAVRNREGLELECYAVTNDRGFISQKDAHDDFGYMVDVDTTAYNIVPPNSFAYNHARINVGSIGYYAGTENVIVSSLYEVFQTADYVDDRFLWHWFKSEHFPKWIERLQEGSVRLYFYYDKLIQCEIKMPSLEEQMKIGAYFNHLDHLITLHQHKCDELQKLKKFMLQNMFM